MEEREGAELGGEVDEEVEECDDGEFHLGVCARLGTYIQVECWWFCVRSWLEEGD